LSGHPDANKEKVPFVQSSIGKKYKAVLLDGAHQSIKAFSRLSDDKSSLIPYGDQSLPRRGKNQDQRKPRAEGQVSIPYHNSTPVQDTNVLSNSPIRRKKEDPVINISSSCSDISAKGPREDNGTNDIDLINLNCFCSDSKFHNTILLNKISLNNSKQPAMPEVNFKISYNNVTRTVKALLDPAAGANFVSPQLANDLRLDSTPLLRGQRVRLGDGSITHAHKIVTLRNGYLYLPQSDVDSDCTEGTQPSNEGGSTESSEELSLSTDDSRKRRRAAVVLTSCTSCTYVLY
jgi:hypothetical protein